MSTRDARGGILLLQESLVPLALQGYRYELWCVARAAGTRYCMVHVATDTDTCRQWNAARPEAERYSDAV